MKMISLTRGMVTVVDDDDYETMSCLRWGAGGGNRGRWYAASRRNGRTIYLHRLLMDAREGQEVDHIDGNSLNNQRANLRFATRSQQNMNSKPRQNKKYSRYKGVYWVPARPENRSPARWVWELTDAGVRVRGHALTEEAAALKYNEAALQHFGAFARPNELN